MTTWRFRYILPEPSEWCGGTGESATAAIQSHHVDNQYLGVEIRVPLAGGEETQSFALVETEDGEQWISRACRTEFIRRGGVRTPRGGVRDLAHVAKTLGVSLEKLQGPWDGEESYP